jgi:hypothetical protein
LSAAQRAAGEAFWGTLKAQLKPSALLAALPAAKAALLAVKQNTKIVAARAAMISVVNLTADLPNISRQFPCKA